MTFLMKYKIVDKNGQEITVGNTIRLMDWSRDAEVIEITEPDIDYNDALQKPTITCPYVTVRFDDAGLLKLLTEDETRVTWADYPDGPDEYVFGLEVSVIAV